MAPIMVSDNGWQIVESELSGAIDLGSALTHVNKLIELELYDTAIREVSVVLETALRDQSGSQLWDEKLISHFLAELNGRDGPIRSAQSIYRLRLRSFFKFVRNEFAHTQVALSRSRGLSIIAHGALLVNDIRELGDLTVRNDTTPAAEAERRPGLDT